mmetsp:Transcript_24369/g.96652  ORF Transcript_24369/g.96652 Transcript_24369/m.96652 type:complete len:200 (-) Transcript_24369:1068-1667(-)
MMMMLLLLRRIQPAWRCCRRGPRRACTAASCTPPRPWRPTRTERPTSRRGRPRRSSPSPRRRACRRRSSGAAAARAAPRTTTTTWASSWSRPRRPSFRRPRPTLSVWRPRTCPPPAAPSSRARGRAPRPRRPRAAWSLCAPCPRWRATRRARRRGTATPPSRTRRRRRASTWRRRASTRGPAPRSFATTPQTPRRPARR